MSDEARPGMRASDIDRELTAKQLSRHATAGRLTLVELDQRLAWAYEAKTIGDLQELTSDLPELPADASSAVVLDKPSPPAPPANAGPRAWTTSRAMWGSYLSVNLMQILIWALISMATTSWLYPWWIWIAGPWGVALIGQEIQRRASGSRSIQP